MTRVHARDLGGDRRDMWAEATIGYLPPGT